MKCLKQKNKTQGIAIAGQMHSLVLLDKNNEVIRNAILWNDVRTTNEVELINDTIDIIDVTQNKALEGFTLPKMLWVKENEPENYNKINSFLLPKDYLVFCLTEEKVMDYSDASGTLMIDFKTNQWSENIFGEFDINLDWAPQLKWSSDYVSDISLSMSKELGFESSVKVFAGAADNAAAALSAGITGENTALVSLGTSGVFLSPEETNTKHYQGQLHYFNHSIKDKYYSMGVTIAAGKSLSWLKDVLDKELDYDDLLQDIDKVDPGSNGLLFTPYIMGERTPYTDSKIRGSFIGLDVIHTKNHILRSVLEGITFSLKDSMNIMESLGKDIKSIISVGGGARNKTWLQIQADIFGVPIVTLSNEEGPAQGAAMAAAIGLKWYDTVTDCVQNFVDFDKTIKPDKTNVQTYQEYYEVYKKIYNATAPLSKDIQTIRERK